MPRPRGRRLGVTPRLPVPLLAVSLILALLPRGASDRIVAPLRNGVQFLYAEPTAWCRATRDAVGRAAVAVAGLGPEADRARRAEQRAAEAAAGLAAAEAAIERLERSVSELAALRTILGSPEPPLLPARIYGQRPRIWPQALWIDRGTAHGVRPGFPVACGGALVGRIDTAGPTRSRVRLLTDAGSTAWCRVIPAPREGDPRPPPDRRQGVLVGTGEPLAEIQYLPVEEPVGIGDRVFTTGSDGRFPADLTIGVVAEVLPGDRFHRIRVRPAVPFDRIVTVQVILEETPEGPPETGDR